MRVDRAIQLEVGDGLLLADSAVRMAVKNYVLTAALRPGARWEPDPHLSFAAGTLRRIAQEQDDAAMRMANAHDDAVGALDRPSHEHDYGEIDVALLDKRRIVYRSVAAELRRRSADEVELRAVIEAGRADAWFELGAAIEQRLLREPSVERGITETVQGLIHRNRQREELKRALAADVEARGRNHRDD